MRDLLEKAPHNINRGPEYDKLLSEFDAIRTARNTYAHGLRYTYAETGKVYLCARDQHGFGFLEKREEPIKALDALLVRISQLYAQIIQTYGAALAQFVRPLSNLPQSEEPKP
jgi:hypothetical protein